MHNTRFSYLINKYQGYFLESLELQILNKILGNRLGIEDGKHHFIYYFRKRP